MLVGVVGGPATCTVATAITERLPTARVPDNLPVDCDGFMVLHAWYTWLNAGTRLDVCRGALHTGSIFPFLFKYSLVSLTWIA